VKYLPQPARNAERFALSREAVGAVVGRLCGNGHSQVRPARVRDCVEFEQEQRQPGHAGNEAGTVLQPDESSGPEGAAPVRGKA